VTSAARTNNEGENCIGRENCTGSEHCTGSENCTGIENCTGSENGTGSENCTGRENALCNPYAFRKLHSLEARRSWNSLAVTSLVLALICKARMTTLFNDYKTLLPLRSWSTQATNLVQMSLNVSILHTSLSLRPQ
jgi:hypothetical protein